MAGQPVNPAAYNEGMATTGTLMSAEEFDRLPVEESRHFELLEGELAEVSSPTFEHNHIQMVLSTAIHNHLAKGPGVIIPTTEFAFGADRCQPDLAIFADDRWKQWDRTKVPVGITPDIAVEIISPSETAYRVDAKIGIYLSNGVKEVWEMYSTQPPHLFVHQRNSVRRLEITDTLSTPLLPGWSIPVRDIFEICA
jgi:Uma2 family endonuclease